MGFVKKLNTKKIVAIAMAFFMVVGLVPTSALAAIATDAVKAGEAIASEGTVTFTACQDTKKNAKTTTVNGVEYDHTLATSGVNNVTVDGATGRAFGVLTATADTNVSFVVYMGSGKKGYIIESATDLSVPATKDNPVALAAEDAVITLAEGNNKYDFVAEAGKFYYLVGCGTNLELWDVINNGPATAETEVGKKYSVNFGALEGAAKLDGFVSEDGVFALSSANDKAYVHDSQHGAALYKGDKISFKVPGAATITLSLCQYGNGTNFVITDAAGEEVGKLAGKVTTDGETDKFIYSGEATTLTVTLEATGEAYLHSIEVEVLDLAGNAEDFSFMFDEKKGEDGKIKTGEYKFGDSVLLLSGETVEGVITDFAVKSDKAITINGKSYECYTSGKRHVDSNSIYSFPGTLPNADLFPDPPIPIEPKSYGADGRAANGLGCLLGFTPAAKGMVTVYYNSTSFLRVYEYGADDQRVAYVDAPTNINSYSFEVVPGHKYVMSTTGKTNNMFYAGISYVVDKKISVPVTVTNVDATVGDGLKLSIIDAQLESDPVALKTDATSVKLLNGHTYKIATNDGGVAVLINGKETFVASEEAIEVQLKDVPDVELTGKIVGTDASTVSKLTFTGMTSGVTFEAVITGDTYKVTLKPGEYNTAVVTTNGGFTKDHASVKAEGTNTNDVYVEVADPATYRALDYVAVGDLQKTGTVGVENGKAHVQGKADDTLVVPMTGKGTITITTYYRAKLDVNGTVIELVDGDEAYNTTSKTKDFTVEVEGDVTIKFVETSYITKIVAAPDAAKVPFKSEIKVPGDYATFNDAVAAINNMADRPAGEAGRVTITLTADIQEQVNMTAPYVTLKGEGHTISWYYGVATKYYSVDPATGLYNKRLAMDRYSSAEGNGNLWGGAFICRGDNFIAENTIFKNTYNYELTEAEKSDIAGTMLAVSRLTEGADVTAYAYKERSNAFYVEADNIELYNCQILSSQDTFGRNGSANNGYHVYLKDCVIGGNTDYICGEFTAVFDNCELRWKSFKNDANNNGKLGFIVAPKTSNYVFRNCKVTTDDAHGEDPVLGKYGRTWGANSTATFINTETNGLISDDGWGEMNSGDLKTAVFNEYNNTKNGAAFVSTGATHSDAATVEMFIDKDGQTAVETLLGSWKPVHYSAAAPETTPTPTPTPVIPVTGETIPFATVAVLLLCVAGAYMLLRRRFAK